MQVKKQPKYLCPQRGLQRTRQETGKGGKEEIRAGKKGTEREREERTRIKEKI